MEDVEALCERVVVINHGIIAYDGSLKQMMSEYINSKILEITFTEAVFKKDFVEFGKIKEWDKMRVVLDVPKEKVKQVAAEILKNLPVDDILINEIQVEEVIRKMFQEKK